jgi:hypothetical protein
MKAYSPETMPEPSRDRVRFFTEVALSAYETESVRTRKIERFKNARNEEEQNKILVNLLNDFRRTQRKNLFEELSKLYGGWKGFENDFKNFSKVLADMHNEPMRDNDFVCESEEEDNRREQIIEAVNSILDDKWSTRPSVRQARDDSSESDENDSSSVLEMCAYDAMLVLGGANGEQNYRTKSAILLRTARALFPKTTCDQVDTALLCTRHIAMQRFKLISSYDLFNYQAEPYIGAMNDKNNVYEFVFVRHGGIGGPKMPTADPMPANIWGDYRGRVARGVFVRVIEEMLLKVDGLDWRSVQDEFKDVLGGYANNRGLTGSNLMEGHNGELAAEMVAIAYRIFNNLERTNWTRSAAKMPTLEEYTSTVPDDPDTFKAFGNRDDFGEEYGEEADKEAGRAYIRRLMYTSKKYSWFLNVPLAPMTACMLERAVTKPEFVYDNTTLGSPPRPPPEIIAATHEEDGITILDYHRDFGLRVEDGRAQAASEKLSRIQQFGFRMPPSAAVYREHAFKDMGLHTAWKLWSKRPMLQLEGETTWQKTKSAVTLVRNGYGIYLVVLLIAVPVIGPSAATSAAIAPVRAVGSYTVVPLFRALFPSWVVKGAEIVASVPGYVGQGAGFVYDWSAWFTYANIRFGGAVGNTALAAMATVVQPFNRPPVGQDVIAYLMTNEVGTNATVNVHSKLRMKMPQHSKRERELGVADIGTGAESLQLVNRLMTDLAWSETTELDPVVKNSPYRPIGGTAANAIGLMSITMAVVDDVTTDDGETGSMPWPREVRDLLESNPDGAELERELRALFPPDKMRMATFDDVAYTPPITRARSAGDPRRVRPRRSLTKASLAERLDIVAPLEWSVAALEL